MAVNCRCCKKFYLFFFFDVTYFVVNLGPSAPVIRNLTTISTTMIYLKWEKPEIIYWRVDMYVIRFRSRSGEIFGERQVSGKLLEVSFN